MRGVCPVKPVDDDDGFVIAGVGAATITGVEGDDDDDDDGVVDLAPPTELTSSVDVDDAEDADDVFDIIVLVDVVFHEFGRNSSPAENENPLPLPSSGLLLLPSSSPSPPMLMLLVSLLLRAPPSALPLTREDEADAMVESVAEDDADDGCPLLMVVLMCLAWP